MARFHQANGLATQVFLHAEVGTIWLLDFWDASVLAVCFASSRVATATLTDLSARLLVGLVAFGTEGHLAGIPATPPTAASPPTGQPNYRPLRYATRKLPIICPRMYQQLIRSPSWASSVSVWLSILWVSTNRGIQRSFLATSALKCGHQALASASRAYRRNVGNRRGRYLGVDSATGDAGCLPISSQGQKDHAQLTLSYV